MRGGCFAARMEYVRDAFAWELAVVVLYWGTNAHLALYTQPGRAICWQAAPRRMTMSSGPLHLTDSTTWSSQLALLAAAAQYHLPGLDN